MTTRTITLSAEHWQTIKNTLLNLCVDDPYVSPDLSAACDALEAALAQPGPEGMADLTDEEIDELYHSSGGVINVFARAVWSRAQAARPAIAPISASEFLKPEWKRQEDQTRKTTDGAQLIDGEWWAPCSDPFNMQRILDNARAHSRPAIEPVPLSTEAAFAMGQTGGPPSEAERLAFEAWMRGHSWLVAGRWNGTTYADSQERHSSVDVPAMHTRMLWAAWRDRSALGRPAIEPVPVSERPWEREGWCDAENRCYGWDGDYWWMIGNPEAADETITHLLPHYALPVPTSQEA